MTINEIKNAARHLKETCKCTGCSSNYSQKDMSVLASTEKEGLFEMKCPNCKANSIVTVYIENVDEKSKVVQEKRPRRHRNISQNDILDIRNFLKNFDGDFKKFFTK